MHDRITIKSYNYEPSFAPAGKQIIQTLQGGTEEVFEFWKELYQDNVILAGQWISLPGGLPGSAIAGKFAVQRICKKENMEYIF